MMMGYLLRFEKEIILSMRKQYLYRTFFGFCLSLASYGHAEKDFNGSYVGAGAQYTYNRGNFGAESYKGMSLSSRLFTGYGWVKERLYYGIEGGLSYDSFSKKKDGARLKKTWSADGSCRLGRIIRQHFMPFVRVGVRHDHYTFQPSGAKKNQFGAGMVVYGVGVDAFASDRMIIRSEINYAFCTGFRNNKNVSGKKPLNVSVAMSAAYFL